MTTTAKFIQTENMGLYQEDIDAALHHLSEQNIITRLWNKDHTVWKNEDKEVSDRLGWLSSPMASLDILSALEGLVQSVRADGYSHALLLGMGGSSLAPEVFSRVFAKGEGYLELEILDSSNPGAILSFKNKLNPKKTLFIVSSKSGTTVETLSLFKFFFNFAGAALGKEKAGEHFVAITDPGTPLEKLAEQHHFRSVFAGDLEIGGRFSALSPFGLLPAALIGMDIRKLLKRSQETALLCKRSSPLQDNPGVFLGAVLASMAGRGCDKATFTLSPKIESFAFWLEQLLAESTGKQGKGILPVLGDVDLYPDSYGNDRVFINIRLDGDNTHHSSIKALKEARQPCLILNLSGPYSLGSQFFLWEMATAVIGSIFKINPFDQPNVAEAKVKAHNFIKAYQEKKHFPLEKPRLSDKGLSLFSDIPASSLEKGLKAFLSQAQEGNYVAILAFLPPGQDTEKLLQDLRRKIRNKTKLAVTAGYGPRYLHSTGQFHKGDRGNGLFIQLTADDLEDISIPDEAGSLRSSLSFGILKNAQAEGDYVALREAGRRVIRFHLHQDVNGGLKKIIALLERLPE